jgi:hypothetical protein
LPAEIRGLRKNSDQPMDTTPQKPDDELSLDEKARILREVKLGTPAPGDESGAARKHRERMEDDVDKNFDAGISVEPTWDP